MSADIHTCSYSCQRPACVLAQRDELAKRAEQDAAEIVRLRGGVDRLAELERANKVFRELVIGEGAWQRFQDLERRTKEAEARASAIAPAEAKGDDLHPETADLVARFAAALSEKLAAAERKYGWSTHWKSPAWMDQCRQQLVEHVAKGDPRDVAAYCAFLWHHGERTALNTPQPAGGGAVALGWRVRERRSSDGELLDCFVEAPPLDGMAYGLEVLGDDYTGYGDAEGKLAHCKMIVAWANTHPPAAQVQQEADFPMTDAQVHQWIGACNHEPARQVLRDYLQLRSTHPAGDALGAVPSKRLIGWRSADYLMETDDPALARNWQWNIDVLPIFEGDQNTKLAGQLDSVTLLAAQARIERALAGATVDNDKSTSSHKEGICKGLSEALRIIAALRPSAGEGKGVVGG